MTTFKGLTVEVLVLATTCLRVRYSEPYRLTQWVAAIEPFSLHPAQAIQPLKFPK
jgi:hypothetical protein